MRIIKILIIFLVFGYFSFYGDPLKKTIIPLDINKTDPIFKTASDIRILGDYILLVENFKHRILKYKLGDKLAFKQQLGQRGLGPGDLNLPVRLSIAQAKVAVRDSLGYSIFDSTGKFQKRFRIFSNSSSFVFWDNKVYCVVQSPSLKHLIEVYSDTGKKLADIGKKYLSIEHLYKKTEKRNKPHLVDYYFYSNLILVDQKGVYYLDMKFAQVLKFDKTGKQIFHKDIASFFGKEGNAIKQKNTEISNDRLPINRGRIQQYKFFEDARLVGDNIYLFCYDDREYKKIIDTPRVKYNLNIRVLNKDTLKLVNQFVIPVDRKKERMYCFDVIEKNGKPVFYIATSNTEYDNFLAEYK